MGPSLKTTKLAITAALVHELWQMVGLSQEKFAAKLGVTCLTVSRWERQKATLLPMMLDRMKELLEKLGESPELRLRKHRADLLEQYLPDRITPGQAS